MDVAVTLEKGGDLAGLVCREIVGDDVDFLPRWLVDDDIGQKGNELSRSVTGGGLPEDFPGASVEGGVERERAMPVVLKAVPFGAAGREWQHGIEPIKRLDGGFLVDAEHRGMLRRMQIEGEDIGGLGLEVGIIGSHVPIEPMRLETVLAPHARDHHVRDRKPLPQLARAPVRRAVGGLALDGPLEDASLQLRSQDTGYLPGVSREQTRQALRPEPLAPAVDEGVIAGKLAADLCPGVPGFEPQNQPCAPCIICPPGLARCPLSQFDAFGFRQSNRATHGHDHTTVLTVTVH